MLNCTPSPLLLVIEVKGFSCNSWVVDGRWYKSFGDDVLEVRPCEVCRNTVLLREQYMLIFTMLTLYCKCEITRYVIIGRDGI